MNFLFGFGVAATSSLAVLIVYFFTPLKNVIPRSWLYGFVGLVWALSGYSAFQTYGPRIALASPTGVYTPQEAAIEPTPTVLGTEKDRVGQFDDRLERDKPE